jgi:hypothetical protein
LTKFCNAHSPAAFCVMAHLRTSTFNTVLLHSGGRNDVTPVQVPNSPEEGSSVFSPYPYVKLGMRPARGSNAGVTEVPRIGQDGSSKIEHASRCPLMGTSSNGQPMTHFQPLPMFAVHHTGLIPFHTRSGRSNIIREMVLPTAGPSSSSAVEGRIICHRTSVHMLFPDRSSM